MRRPYPALARTALAWLAVPLLGAPAAAVSADCPAAVVQLGRGAEPFAVTGFVYDSLYVGSEPNFAHVRFDRTAGTLSLVTRAGGGLSAAIRILERFDLEGVAPGTPVGATLELVLDGHATQFCGGAGCGLLCEGRLVVAGDSVAAGTPTFFAGSENLVAALSLPVQLVVGAPLEAAFVLEFGCGPGQTDATSDVAATYRVSGLPPGVRAVPCPGADVTPVRRGTWGELKLRYR